jgi:Raf kinase inhibitor-like YbhB/YbcL family protein
MDKGWMRPVGRALRGVRAGMHGLASQRAWLRGVPECITVASPTMPHGTDVPERYTADGAGLSPPLCWDGVPEGAGSLVLLVEDPDIPFPVPLVHALVYNIPATATGLAEGAIPPVMTGPAPQGYRTGRNGFGRPGWLPCAPPPGHGPHHYAFEVLAVRRSLAFDWPPGRRALLAQMRGHVLGRGVAFWLYERP